MSLMRIVFATTATTTARGIAQHGESGECLCIVRLTVGWKAKQKSFSVCKQDELREIVCANRKAKSMERRD